MSKIICNIVILSVLRFHVDPIIFYLMFSCSPKFFPTVLEAVGLHELGRNLRVLGLFQLHFKRHNCSFARCALMANATSGDSGVSV
jgi:hypothetical protein